MNEHMFDPTVVEVEHAGASVFALVKTDIANRRESRCMRIGNIGHIRMDEKHRPQQYAVRCGAVRLQTQASTRAHHFPGDRRSRATLRRRPLARGLLELDSGQG